jgi:archaellum component FlaC
MGERVQDDLEKVVSEFHDIDTGLSTLLAQIEALTVRINAIETRVASIHEKFEQEQMERSRQIIRVMNDINELDQSVRATNATQQLVIRGPYNSFW